MSFLPIGKISSEQYGYFLVCTVYVIYFIYLNCVKKRDKSTEISFLGSNMNSI